MLGDQLIFSANDGTHGNELWATDGTVAGTVLTITGEASIETYQTILQGVQYNNTDQNPDATDRRSPWWSMTAKLTVWSTPRPSPSGR